MKLFQWITQDSAWIMIMLALILLMGFACTRLTKWARLPNVTGYILSGVLLGPYVLHIVPDALLQRMDFITDVALAFIAFDVGRFFQISTLRKNGKQVLVITVLEALMAAAFITATMIGVFHLPISFALILGAIGCATAPASTLMTIRQYHAKGSFVDMLLQVVALDDAVALITFSLCATVAQAVEQGGRINMALVGPPLLINLGVVLLGALMGWILHRFITQRRSPEHRLILAIAQILLLSGLCVQWQVSPLLACMAMGAVYRHCSNERKLFKQLSRFSPPVLMLFFTLSGMRMNLPALATAGIIGIGYFIVRIVGKYIGAWVGGKISHATPEICRYLGLALIPQAGVSIGLAALGERLLPSEMGTLLSTIILSSAVLYEMIGPVSAKLSLRLAGVISKEPPESIKKVKVTSPVPIAAVEKPEGPDDRQTVSTPMQR